MVQLCACKAVSLTQERTHDENAIRDEENAIRRVFNSISHGDDNAYGLGCVVWKLGTFVTARRMPSPFDTYAAVRPFGTGSDDPGSDFFTMEDELTNDPSADILHPSDQALADDHFAESDTGRLQFQAQLEKLEKPMPNLRWLPTGQDELLVTPYGPCASLTESADSSQGYVVLKEHINPYMPSVPVDVVGTFAEKGTAATAAEKYCHEWYVAETGNAQNKAVIDHMWFTSDSEEAVNAPSEASAEIVRPSTATGESTPIANTTSNVPPISITPSSTQDPTESKRLNTEGLHMLSGANPNFASARNDFERAFQLDSTNIEALNNLGYVYGRLGDYHTAESTLLKVIAMSPTRKAAQGNLGAIQAELGKTQEAANHFCQYIRLFDSLEHGKATLTRANKDSDQNIQAAITMALANCK